MLQRLTVLRPGQSVEQQVEFEALFKSVWADNADYISIQYSGTGALKTDFTRTGKRTYLGALNDLNNSITRYYKNNFLDGFRQVNGGGGVFMLWMIVFETRYQSVLATLEVEIFLLAFLKTCKFE